MTDDRWRKVSEEMPQTGWKVIACRGLNLPFIASYNSRLKEWWDETGLMRDPTYWRPLPAPPEED